MRRSAILADHRSSFAPADTTYTSTRLTWQPAVERDRVVRPDVAAYVVQQNGREILRLPAWATSVTVGALAPGSTYSFSVYSIDASGDRTADSATDPGDHPGAAERRDDRSDERRRVT